MASTEAIAAQRVPALTPEVQAQLQQLVVDSHWNQLPADWAQFFQLGTLYAVRDARGAISASGAVLPMGAPTSPGPAVSWISMILVTPAQRGQGLGRAVFASCLAQVLAEDRVPMLDATPQGEALYAQFGFEPQWRFTRWRRAQHGAAPGATPKALPVADGSEPRLRQLQVLRDTEDLEQALPALLATAAGGLDPQRLERQFNRLRASWGQGFRAPNFNELYYPGFFGFYAGNGWFYHSFFNYTH